MIFTTTVKQNLLFRIATPLFVIVAVFFLLFSCNSVEFSTHNEQSSGQTSSLECHQSTFTANTRNDLVAGIFLLLLLFGLSNTYLKYLFTSSNNLRGIHFIHGDPPPRVYNFYTLLFSRGILNPKLF